MADHRDLREPSLSFGGMSFGMPQFKDKAFPLPTTSEVQVFSFDGYPTPSLTQEQVNQAAESLARFAESLPEDQREVLTYLIRLADAASAVL